MRLLMRKVIAIVLRVIADVLWPPDHRGRQIVIINEPPVDEEDTQPYVGWDERIGEYRSGWRIIEREGFDKERRVE